MLVTADLHVHGRYARSVSRDMTFDRLADGARRKGIDLLGTGDCLHPLWLKAIDGLRETAPGTYEHRGVTFVLQGEVIDRNRVHHLLFFPERSSVTAFQEGLTGRGAHLDRDGRPPVPLRGEELAELAVATGASIGPAHAFTPWTGLLGRFPSLAACYGDLAAKVRFIELGLSADTSYADRVPELRERTFLTCSDAHSPEPDRLAREFTRFELPDATAASLRNAIHGRGPGVPVLNVGLPPDEGKYNRTACCRCFRQTTARAALRSRWKCRCGGRITRGVRDRVAELSDGPRAVHPAGRPPYLRLIPLAEIIGLALGKGPRTASVAAIWNGLLDRFGNEVRVLIDVPIEEIDKGLDPRVLRAVRAFRTGRIGVQPGGGGRYGSVRLRGRR